MKIGAAIKQIRESKGISQGELARAIEVTQTWLSLIESGKDKRPSAPMIKKICTHLGVSEPMLYILGTEESDVPDSKRALFNELFPNIRSLAVSLMKEE
jgi:transcriptional regulator with XRE-family HTH domain